MVDCTEYWCPIRRDWCHEDCAWLDVEYSLDEEGVGRQTYCAIGVIASAIREGQEPGKWQYVDQEMAMALEKPASVARSPYKSVKWDEVVEGRRFTAAHVPALFDYQSE